jgi:hypothetical protein
MSLAFPAALNAAEEGGNAQKSRHERCTRE